MRHNKVDLKPNTKLRDAVSQYTRSANFAKLSSAVQYKYESTLNRVCATKVQNGAELGNIKLSDIRYKQRMPTIGGLITMAHLLLTIWLHA